MTRFGEDKVVDAVFEQHRDVVAISSHDQQRDGKGVAAIATINAGISTSSIKAIFGG